MNHITEFEVFERLTVIDLNQCRSSGFASAGVVFFSAFSKKPQMVKWGWVVYIVMIFDHMWWKLMICDYITICHCIWQENSTWTRVMVFQLRIYIWGVRVPYEDTKKTLKKNPLRHLGNSTLYQPSQNFQGLVLSGSRKTHKKTPSLVPSTNSSTNRHASSGVGPATAGPACTATASTASTSSVTGGEVEAWMMGWNLEMGHNNLQ